MNANKERGRNYDRGPVGETLFQLLQNKSPKWNLLKKADQNRGAQDAVPRHVRSMPGCGWEARDITGQIDEGEKETYNQASFPLLLETQVLNRINAIHAAQVPEHRQNPDGKPERNINKRKE